MTLSVTPLFSIDYTPLASPTLYSLGFIPVIPALLNSFSLNPSHLNLPLSPHVCPRARPWGPSSLSFTYSLGNISFKNFTSVSTVTRMTPSSTSPVNPHPTTHPPPLPPAWLKSYSGFQQMFSNLTKLKFFLFVPYPHYPKLTASL